MMPRCALPLLIALLAGSTPVAAQSPEGFALRFGPAQGAVGGEADITVLLDSAFAVSAWSLGVCHGPEVEVVSVTNGSAAEALEPLALNSINLHPGAGWTAGVLIDFLGVTTLPPGSGAALHRARYALLAEGDATLVCCDSLGSPPVATVLSLPSGVTYAPIQTPGTIAIGLVPPIECRLADATGSAGVPLELSVSVDNPVALDGFAFGFAADAAALPIEAITPGAALLAATGGLGPDYFAPNLAPSGGDGATVACLLSLVAAGSPLPSGVDQEVVVITATPASGLGDAVLPVDFTDALGEPPVLTRMTVAGVSVLPVLSGGTVTVTGTTAGPLFIRGEVVPDGSITLGDPIALLNYLFAGGDPLPCEAAGDIDDDGQLLLGDVVQLLGYLFSGGAEPAAPFPSCGIDPTPGDLGCGASPGCP
jgi:hypothetical protein